MTEEENVLEKMKESRRAYSPDEDKGQLSGQAVNLLYEDRLSLIQWIIRTGAIGAAIALAFNLAFFFQSNAWQLLIVVAGEALAIFILIPASILARRDKLNGASYLLIISLSIAFGVAELAQAGITLYLTAGGVLLIIAVSSLIFPPQTRWTIAISAAAIYAIYIGLINWLEPLPRYDIQRFESALFIFVLAFISLLTLVTLWQVVRAYQRIATIRAWLLVSFVAVVLLTVVAVSIGSILTSMQSGRRQVINQLESVATLKEAEIYRWTTDMKNTLSGALQQEPEHRYVRPEMGQVISVLLDEPPDSENYQEAKALLEFNFEQWIKQTQLFEAVFLMGPEGKVLISTDPEMEGQIHIHEPYFLKGTVSSYVHPPSYSPALNRVTVMASRPVIGEYGRLLGVVAGRASIGTLSRIMGERTGLGETGETYLVGINNALLTSSRFIKKDLYVRSEAANTAINEQTNGSMSYDDYREVPVIGVYHWLPELQVALIAEQDQAEALSILYRTVRINVAIAMVALAFAGAISLLVSRSIGDPLNNLAETASQIAEGDLERTAHVDRRDEIGTLAQAFNQMTAQLRDLIGGLEQRVAERTRDLEVRSAYLEASAEVGHAASSILEIEKLIQEVVNLIRERFGLYYVGLFLLEETGEWAVLRAGTGKAGQEMLAQEHKLRVGGESMIGQCVAQGRALIALDVGEEAVRFDNPFLPDTRSEGALPLRSRERTFGAITVQSAISAAFDEDTITVLETMADQVAVALDNAYLFAEAQEALEATQRAYGELSRRAWVELLQEQPDIGYHIDEYGISSTEDVLAPEMEQALKEGQTVLKDSNGQEKDSRYSLTVPIKVRDNVIGILDTYKQDYKGNWTHEEITLLEALAERLGSSLESARLYRETQRRATEEQLLSEITTHLRETLDVDKVLQTAANELREVFDLKEAEVRIALPDLQVENEE